MLEQRLTALEDEVKVLNNEIKQVLLDIREEVIARFQNPLPEFETGPLDKDAPAPQTELPPADPSGDPTRNAGAETKAEAGLWDPTRAVSGAGGAPTAASGNNAGPTIISADGGRPAGREAAVAPGDGKSSTGPEKWVPGKALVAEDPMNVNVEAAVMEAGKSFEEEDADSPSEECPGEPAGKPEEGENEMEIKTDPLEAKKNGKNGAKSKAVAIPEAREAALVGERPDLLTVATLSRWLTNGMRQVGQERMEAIIDIYEAMGGISPELKEILLRLLRIHDGEGAPLSKTMAVLMELDNLQTRNRLDKTEAAVLSLFLSGNGRKEVCHR